MLKHVKPLSRESSIDAAVEVLENDRKFFSVCSMFALGEMCFSEFYLAKALFSIACDSSKSKHFPALRASFG